MTANVPAKLLERARRTTGLDITATIVAGLEELERAYRRAELRKLRGKVRFDLHIKTRR